MRRIFANTLYWLAILDVRDPWHARVVRASLQLGPVRLVTTDAVLLDVANGFSESGPVMRQVVVTRIRDLFSKPGAEVVPLDRPLFLSGLDLYDRRPDKGYSLTDCISMHVMRERGLREVLTNDHHFEQEGFDVLIPSR